MPGLNISGPIESMTIAGRFFEVNASDAVTIQLSGKSNEVRRSGNGGKRIVRSFVDGLIENAKLKVTHSRGDLEYLAEKRDASDFFDLSMTMCDGTVYSGSVQLTGDLKEDMQDGTIGVTLSGDLEKQG